MLNAVYNTSRGEDAYQFRCTSGSLIIGKRVKRFDSF